MFRFANSEYLYLLLLIPVLAIIYALVARRRRHLLAKFGNLELLQGLMPDFSRGRLRLKFVLYLLAFACVVLAAARPQFGSKLREEKSKGVEMMLVVDVSNSMLAEDFEPNRLERTKYAIGKLFEGLHQERVGLVAFAGEPKVQLPITSDYRMAQAFAKRLSPSLVGEQGTAVGKALQLATLSFSSQSEQSRVIVLITDGENHEDDAVGAAEEAYKKGIQINVMAIGTQKGGPIPMGDGSYLKDEYGNMVISVPNEDIAKDVAKAGKGIFVSANSNDAINTLDARLKELSKSNIQKTVFSPSDEQFPIFAWIILAIIIIDIFVLDRKIFWLKKINFFTK